MDLAKTVFLKRVLTCTLGRRKPSRGIPDTRRPPGSRVRPQHRRFSQRWPPQTQNLDFQKILEFSVRRRVHLLDFSTFPPVISPPTQIMSSSETGKKKPKCDFPWSKKIFLEKKPVSGGNLGREETLWGILDRRPAFKSLNNYTFPTFNKKRPHQRFVTWSNF